MYFTILIIFAPIISINAIKFVELPILPQVVCVEASDEKKQRDNWFPGLVVAPTAQEMVKIDTKKDYLVRSFQDGR